MKKTGNWYKRCVYVYEFSDNCAYVGLTYNLSERNLNRKKDKDDAITKHIRQTQLVPTLKQLTEYVSVNIASSLEIFYIDEYRKNGWNILNVAKGGTTGNCIRLWTHENCEREALKYNSRNEFKKNNKPAYESARKYGWLNEICSHMKFMLIYWTYELCEKEASKYPTRTKLHDNCPSAYNRARKNNWLNSIYK
jgi:predicted GIY-YIG superfamily endonuclease